MGAGRRTAAETRSFSEVEYSTMDQLGVGRILMKPRLPVVSEDVRLHYILLRIQSLLFWSIQKQPSSIFYWLLSLHTSLRFEASEPVLNVVESNANCIKFILL